MKLNSKIRGVKYTRTQANTFLMRIIQDVIKTFGKPPIPDYEALNPLKTTSDFFEKYYVQLDSKGKINHSEFSEPISTSEAEIITYLLDESSHTVPLIIHGAEGVGKSTLIKYICFYLWYKKEVLSKSLFPIYLPISTKQSEISGASKRQEIFSILDGMIYDQAFETMYAHIENMPQKVLSWINIHSQYGFKGKFSRDRVSNIIKKGICNYLEKLSEDQLRSIILDTLCYYSVTERKVLLIIDDIDRFDIDVHRICLEYTDLMIIRGFVLVAAMRTTTYKRLDSLIFEHTDYVPQELKYTIDTVKEILKSRIKKAHERFKLIFIPKVDTNAEQLTNAFINLLQHEDSLDLLSSLSNQSLDVLFREFRLILESKYFNDSIITPEILHQVAIGSKQRGAPIWVTYSLLLGNYFGSYKTADETVNCGIMNVFSSKGSSQEYLKHFVRLHMLSAFHSDSDDSYFEVANIYKEYSRLFADDVHFTETFNRSIYRLVQARLLESDKHTRHDINLENILEDKLMITNAGRFYINSFIHRIEYLYFIKDDINWSTSINLSPAAVSHTRLNKCIDTLRALNVLMRHEYKLLDQISNKTSNETKAQSLFRHYTDNFSPNKVDNTCQSPLFTKWIFASYYKYLHGKPEIKEPLIKQEIKEIENLTKNNIGIEKPFFIKR